MAASVADTADCVADTLLNISAVLKVPSYNSAILQRLTQICVWIAMAEIYVLAATAFQHLAAESCYAACVGVKSFWMPLAKYAVTT